MTLVNDVDRRFATTRAGGRAALMPYLTAGFPDSSGYVDLALAAIAAGADALEIGIPFSDPLLDGPSNQRSQHQALLGGATLSGCLRFVDEIHQRSSDTPLLFMGAYNPIFAFGVARFCREAASSGASGLIVPDLPVEEQDELRDAATNAGLHLIQLVAPTSSDERLQHVCADASGFIYCVSVAGVTGARSDVTDSARTLVTRVRRCTDVPVAVGFGISRPEVARAVAVFADGVIVGSALTDVIAAASGESASPSDYINAAADFVGSLRRAVDRPGQATSSVSDCGAS